MTIDLKGTEVSKFAAHSAEVGSLQAGNDITVQGNIMANNSLLVGAGGINSNGGNLILRTHPRILVVMLLLLELSP